MRKFILVTGLIFLFAVEILRVYFIMPFPGSQQSDSIAFAYWLGRNITWIRILLLLLISYPVYHSFRYNKRWKKIGLGFILLLFGLVFYFVNFKMEADKMFYQPGVKKFSNFSQSKLDTNKLVIGVIRNGEAKAYPIEVIGYHHQVRDSIGGSQVMITYCTVCRTGRVFLPVVNGKNEEFRLVGMDHFNAMFEDVTTKSWWQQATGIAITGKLKGTRLREIESRQMRLGSWIRLYPNSTILQPDPGFPKKYEGLKGFDEGTIKGGLEHRDTLSWQKKSWVIGLPDVLGQPVAYDWNMLVKKQIIEDSTSRLPILIVLEDDGKTFHTYDRRNYTVLNFEIMHGTNTMRDLQTGSVWNMNGFATEGLLKGQQLPKTQSYQEFWHSWLQFHPDTKKYE